VYIRSIPSHHDPIRNLIRTTPVPYTSQSQSHSRDFIFIQPTSSCINLSIQKGSSSRPLRGLPESLDISHTIYLHKVLMPEKYLVPNDKQDTENSAQCMTLRPRLDGHVAVVGGDTVLVVLIQQRRRVDISSTARLLYRPSLVGLVGYHPLLFLSPPIFITGRILKETFRDAQCWMV